MNLYHFGMQISVSIGIFALFFTLWKFLIGKLRGSSNKYLNPSVYLPEEEVKTLNKFII